jgi:hypothetical protein
MLTFLVSKCGDRVTSGDRASRRSANVVARSSTLYCSEKLVMKVSSPFSFPLKPSRPAASTVSLECARQACSKEQSNALCVIPGKSLASRCDVS